VLKRKKKDKSKQSKLTQEKRRDEKADKVKFLPSRLDKRKKGKIEKETKSEIELAKGKGGHKNTKKDEKTDKKGAKEEPEKEEPVKEQKKPKPAASGGRCACGHQCSSKFCPECGAKVGGTPPTPSDDNRLQRQGTKEDKKPKITAATPKKSESTVEGHQSKKQTSKKRKHECADSKSTKKQGGDSESDESVAKQKVGKKNVRTELRGINVSIEPSREAQRQHLEEQRWRKVKWLKNRLYRLCKQAKAVVPLLAFTRWLSRCKLHQQELLQQQGGEAVPSLRNDPLLPDPSTIPSDVYVDEGLAKDLMRRNPKLGLDEARIVSLKMSEAATEAVLGLNEGDAKGGGQIVVVEEKGVLTLQLPLQLPSNVDDTALVQAVGGSNDGSSTAKSRMPIAVNKSHYGKLKELFDATKSGDDDDDSDAAAGEFDSSVWCLLTRYDTLRPHGYQAALNQHGFRVLERRLGVSCECFASPLNCHFGSGGYCSAFPDTDNAFGSRGSFFESYPTKGSFEANPPFVPELMLSMVKHMEVLLTLSTEGGHAHTHGGGASAADGDGGDDGDDDDNAMSFCVIIPAWESKPKTSHQSASWNGGGSSSSQPTYPAYKFLEASKWKRRSFLVDAGAHGFRNGAQHQCEDRDQYKPSFYDTAIIVLQNAAGARKWRVDGEHGSALELELKEAMAKAKGDEWSGRRVRDGLQAVSK
jgi:hypothetical protein